MDRPQTARAAASLLLAALGGLGCNLDITRVRANAPLDQEAYKQLVVDRATMAEALAGLGAPDKLEHKGGLDYHWYLHLDATRIGLRFESPVSIFGYRHTFVEMDVDAEDTSAMRLVFDQGGLLRQKSLRLAPAFAAPEAKSPEWKLYLLPRYGLSPMTFGDAGEEPFGELYSHGHLFGGYVGVLPAPYFMLLFGGNFQTYQGKSFRSSGFRISVDDLDLYQFEAGGRFQVPPEFFVSFWDIQKLKALFYTDDLSRHRGFLTYFQWTLGATVNGEVGAAIDGVPSGSYFDRSVRFSSTLGVGVEYRWPKLGFFGGLDYQSINPFEEGDAPLDNDAGGFQSFIFTAGVSWRL
ncbi:MAG: hypothetical protein ACRDHY_15030 [Anaerolineales bacterium]